MSKIALITGITGQDGSYLAELLLHKGYEVHGIMRRSSTFSTERIEHIFPKLKLHYGDLADGTNLVNLLNNIMPDEIYHLGAMSHVRASFDIPVYTGEITGLGTTRLLEAIRHIGFRPRFYQASSSEMFGSSSPPQNEETPFCPQSPYAVAKVYAYWTARNYRDGYGLYITNGILFNHESPRRGKTFVTRKITRAVARIKAGLQKDLYLGNLDSKRDWGYTPEYVEVMWKMVQEDIPDDYVLGTGETHTVREFVREAFNYVDLDWKKYVKFDKRYLRPTEVDVLQANSTKAKYKLDWEPQISFYDLVKIMVDADLQTVGLSPIGKGVDIVDRRFGSDWHTWDNSVTALLKEM